MYAYILYHIHRQKPPNLNLSRIYKYIYTYLELHQNCNHVLSNFNPSTFKKAISVYTAKYNDHSYTILHNSLTVPSLRFHLKCHNSPDVTILIPLTIAVCQGQQAIADNLQVAVHTTQSSSSAVIAYLTGRSTIQTVPSECGYIQRLADTYRSSKNSFAVVRSGVRLYV